MLSEMEEYDASEYELDDDERAAIRRGLREMREGTLARDEAVAAVFARYRHA